MSIPTVLICGTDDLATACALRLFRAGFKPVLLAALVPYDLHYFRTFTRAVYAGAKTIDSIRARTWSNVLEQDLLPMHGNLNDFIQFTLLNNELPIVQPKDVKRGFVFSAEYVVCLDSAIFTVFKKNFTDSAVLIGLQGETIKDTHYQISVHKNYLGRVIYPFNKDAFETVVTISSKNTTIKAPSAGIFQALKEPGQPVFTGDEIGLIDDLPLTSTSNGIIEGQLNSGIFVPAGQPVVEIGSEEHADRLRILPSTAFAIAGGVLEAILFDWHRISEI